MQYHTRLDIIRFGYGSYLIFMSLVVELDLKFLDLTVKIDLISLGLIAEPNSKLMSLIKS